MRICGERDGDSFYLQTRPSLSGSCPDGTEPCSSSTSAENTVCYPKSELQSSCPITFMDIVSPLKEIEYKMGSYDMLGIDSDHTLVYSKS